MKRKKLQFNIFGKEERKEAELVANGIWEEYYTPYMKKHYNKPKVMDWTSQDKKEKGYIVWYYI